MAESSSSRLNRSMIVAVVAIIALAVVAGLSAASYVQTGNKISSYSNIVSMQSSTIGSLNGQVSSQSNQIQSLNGQVLSQSDQIQNLNGQLSSQSVQIGSLNSQLTSQSEQVSSESDQISSQSSEISSLEAVSASLSSDALNPTVTILKGQLVLPPGYFTYQSIPDTFDYHDSFTSNSSVFVYYFTDVQFAEWLNGSSIAGSYPTPLGPATSGSDTFTLAEGCGAYVAVYFPQNHSVGVTLTFDISVTHNVVTHPTGACAG